MNLFFKDLIVLQIYENIFWNLSKLFNLLELHSSPHEKVLRNLKGGHGWSLVVLPKLNAFLAEPNIFLRICTHTHTIPINNDLCPPMPTHSMTCAHPCPPMLFKLRPCIQKLCNVYYPPTPSLGWIGHIKCRILSMASAWSASWLAYSLHLEVWLRLALDARMHKTNAHPCPPKTHGYRWAWVWAPNVGLCFLVCATWWVANNNPTFTTMGARAMWCSCIVHSCWWWYSATSLRLCCGACN